MGREREVRWLMRRDVCVVCVEIVHEGVFEREHESIVCGKRFTFLIVCVN